MDNISVDSGSADQNVPAEQVAEPATAGMPPGLERDYVRKIKAWPGLSMTQKTVAALLLVRLHRDHDSLPFDELHDQFDVVGVVIRTVCRYDVKKAFDAVLNEWLPGYRELESLKNCPDCEEFRPEFTDSLSYALM